jgi:hypothetical protein
MGGGRAQAAHPPEALQIPAPQNNDLFGAAFFLMLDKEPRVYDANVNIVGNAVTDCGRFSAEFRIFDRGQDLEPLVQESDSDPIALPEPIPQIAVSGPMADLILNDTQNPPEDQVLGFQRGAASRHRLAIAPKLPDGIAALPDFTKISRRSIHLALSSRISLPEF